MKRIFFVVFCALSCICSIVSVYAYQSCDDYMPYLREANKYFFYPNGEGDVRYSNKLMYINGVPIRVYQDDYIIAEELVHYGFDVKWDNENKHLMIKKIPGKEPDPLTDEEYNELTTRMRTSEKITEYYRYYHGNIRVSLGNIYNLGVDEVLFSEKGTFIPASQLGHFGSYTYDKESRITNISIDYDSNVCRPSLTPFVYRTTDSLNNFVFERKGRKYLNKYVFCQYGFEEEIFFVDYDRSSNALYLSFDNMVSYCELTYSFTEDSLIIEKGTEESKQGIQNLINFNYRAAAPPNTRSLSCVDLKLVSGGETYRTDELFPPLISHGEDLYIRADALFNCL